MFALGVAPRPRERRRVHYPRDYVRPVPSAPPNRFFIKRKPEPWQSFVFPKWCILPDHCIEHKGIRFTYEFQNHGFTHQYLKCQFIPCPFKHATPEHKKIWDETRRELLAKYFLNQKLRWAMKNLLNRWLSKKLSYKNDMDPITLEEPKQPITLIDWRNRAKFTFEASSLRNDMRSKLLTHEELFPMPCAPRNPLTNAPLNYGQIHSILEQIRLSGKTDWVLEAFREAKYDIYMFSRDNSRKLRLFALRDLLGTAECRYVLADFIESQHQTFQKHYDSRVYEWAITSQRQSIKRIQAWKEMCYKYYELEIVIDDVDEREKRQRLLGKSIEPLCNPCEELRMLRRMLTGKRRQA
jgi:hypothetical protein